MASFKPVLAREQPLPEPTIPPDFDLDRAVEEIDQWDLAVFGELISTDISAAQTEALANPERLFPRQESVLAVHWHPEWIPLDLAARRIETMFPDARNNLIIPTQHNQLLVMGDYAGVEVDAYSSGFNRKVQLLLHFRAERVSEAGVLRSILDHTFKYRASQLLEFIDTILNPKLADRFEEAVAETGASPELAQLVQFYTARLKRLYENQEGRVPEGMVKNKLLTEYMAAQRKRHPATTVNRALLLLKAVKAIVKNNFSLDYFFRASEIIEEARSLGGGVVIPHPEQFWPILLADYDVDGYEVWNPQSREYTDFLIRALNNQNKRLPKNRRSLLIFMGDDTHLSVKLRDPATQDPAKYNREVGLQPAWEELAIRKSLSLVGVSKEGVIEAYRDRLN